MGIITGCRGMARHVPTGYRNVQRPDRQQPAQPHENRQKIGRRSPRAGVIELREHPAPHVVGGGNQIGLQRRPHRDQPDDNPQLEQVGREAPVAQPDEQEVEADHAVDGEHVVGVLQAQQERHCRRSPRVAQILRALPQQHQPENDGNQAGGDGEMREGKDGEEGVRLGGVDGKRRIHIGQAKHELLHHQQPAQAASQHGDQEGRPALATVGEHEAAEPVNGGHDKRPGQQACDLVEQRVVQAGDGFDAPQRPPQEIEQQRGAVFRRELVGDKHVGARLTHPGEILEVVRDVECDPHELTVIGCDDVGEEVGQRSNAQDNEDDDGD